MLLNINSFIQTFFNKINFINLLFQKIYLLLNYYNLLFTFLIHKINLNFFFWKTSNYATSYWFLYDRKVNKFSVINLS